MNGVDVLASGLILRLAEDIGMRKVKWIWPGWLARGYLHLYVGDSGAAKSTLTAEIAACITTGRPFFGTSAKRKPADFLWCGLEDPHEEG